MVHKRTLDAKEKYEGAVFKTNNYGDVDVTEYIDSLNITVKFNQRSKEVKREEQLALKKAEYEGNF